MKIIAITALKGGTGKSVITFTKCLSSSCGAMLL